MRFHDVLLSGRSLEFRAALACLTLYGAKAGAKTDMAGKNFSCGGKRMKNSLRRSGKASAKHDSLGWSRADHLGVRRMNKPSGSHVTQRSNPPCWFCRYWFRLVLLSLTGSASPMAGADLFWTAFRGQPPSARSHDAFLLRKEFFDNQSDGAAGAPIVIQLAVGDGYCYCLSSISCALDLFQSKSGNSEILHQKRYCHGSGISDGRFSIIRIIP